MNPFGGAGFLHLDPNDSYHHIRGALDSPKIYSPTKNPFFSPSSTPGNRSPGLESPKLESKSLVPPAEPFVLHFF